MPPPAPPPSCSLSLHLLQLDLWGRMNKRRSGPPAGQDMLLIEFLLVICSFQVSKKKSRKSAASSAEAMGRRVEMVLPWALAQGKTDQRKLFNPQGKPWDKRGLGLLGGSSRALRWGQDLGLEEQSDSFKQHAAPWCLHFLFPHSLAPE